MLFDTLFEFLVYYLGFLLVVGLLGAVFSKKHKELNALNEVNNASGLKKGDLAELESKTGVSQNVVRKKSAFKGLYKHCPCRKAVENGLMSSICIYSSVAGFMLSLTNIAFIGNYAWQNFAVLVLSVLCAWLGWVLKK